MKKFLRSLTLLTLVASLLLACSSCSKDVEKNNAGGSASDGSSSDILSENLAGDLLSGDRKIIETISLSLETKAFDRLLAQVEEKVIQLGGYVESSSVRGRPYGSENLRFGEMTLRIPAKESAGFVGFLDEQSAITSRSVTTEDVTLKYVDTQSRRNALTAEKEALEALLKNAVSIDEVLAIREKLVEVIYEIESLEATLRSYDNRVDYSTVHVRIEEVEFESIGQGDGIWSEISESFQKNLSGVFSFFRSTFVFLVGSIPLLLPVAVYVAILWGLILLIRRRGKKRQK